VFNYEAIDRIPYMAPDLVGAEKAQRGKTPTDVWWLTIVPTNSKEKTGYPTQKPLKLLERIVRVHSDVGDWVLDFFAGSGTTGEAAARLGTALRAHRQPPRRDTDYDRETGICRSGCGGAEGFGRIDGGFR
jgi:site-specific DNA-methyltransferase (adenine-specific)